jgi:hypothetical protein
MWAINLSHLAGAYPEEIVRYGSYLHDLTKKSEDAFIEQLVIRKQPLQQRVSHKCLFELCEVTEHVG